MFKSLNIKIIKCNHPSLQRLYQSAAQCTPKQAPHTPVMTTEVLNYLQPTNEKLYIDMTFGAGGHTRQILSTAPNCRIIALDRDPVAYQMATELAQEFPQHNVIPMCGKFSDLPHLLKSIDIKPNSIDGILFDFGCSSMQFDEAERGFSVSRNGPLDMRMGHDGPTAADVLAKIEEHDLARVLKVYGEEKKAKQIARAIIDFRTIVRRFKTTGELAEVVRSCFADDVRLVDVLHRPTHVATKTFQAIRIFVNNELNEINYGMVLARRLLKEEGRLVAITFHSLEDTVIKRHISGHVVQDRAHHVPLRYSSHVMMEDDSLGTSREESGWHQLHKHVIVPQNEEILANPRSRSAKLRAAIKLF